MVHKYSQKRLPNPQRLPFLINPRGISKAYVRMLRESCINSMLMTWLHILKLILLVEMCSTQTLESRLRDWLHTPSSADWATKSREALSRHKLPTNDVKILMSLPSPKAYIALERSPDAEPKRETRRQVLQDSRLPLCLPIVSLSQPEIQNSVLTSPKVMKKLQNPTHGGLFLPTTVPSQMILLTRVGQ